ncbi:hypothetical protein JW868_00680 [Candidatus Woesearchaeota archaeon]|nr:hypothetical protein [Candidatus Woesearchaeota archaeon]
MKWAKKVVKKADQSENLKPYAYGLFFGVVFLFLVGILQNYGGLSNENYMTGFVVSDAKTISLSGNSYEFKIVSSKCEATPSRIEVDYGSVVEIRYTHYDPDPALYVLSIPEYDVNIGVRDRELRRTRFIADKKGTFDINIESPCDNKVGEFVVT